MAHPMFQPYLTPGLLIMVELGAVGAAAFELPAYAQAETLQHEGDLAETARDPAFMPSELVQNESTSPASSQPTPVKLGMVVFAPPPEDAIPTRSLGAGTRNNRCFTNADGSSEQGQSPQLAVLVPPSQGVGLTEQGKPMLWLYRSVPVLQVLLSVREADSLQFHSQTTVDLPPHLPWIGLRLAEEAPPLEPDIDYEWSVIAICGDRPGPNDPSLSTWIRRVTPQSSHRSPEATPLSLAQHYAQQGLWYDLVTVLMQAQQSPPEREWLSETWSELLNYAGLSSLAPAPPSPSSIQSDS